MKKVFASSLLFICFSAMLSAQSNPVDSGSKFTLGEFVGLNIPKLCDRSNNELTCGFAPRSGEAVGLTVSYPAGANFTLGADLLYSSEGGRRNGPQAMDASYLTPDTHAHNYLYADFDNEYILNYAEIPVLIKYNMAINHSTKFYVDLGPYAGYLLNAVQKISGTSNIYTDKAQTLPLEPTAETFSAFTDISNSIKPFNFGLSGGLGIIKEFGANSFFIDIRGAYGLTTIQKDSQCGMSHNDYLSLSFGYFVSM